MIYYGVTYLMKPQHTVVVFGRQKSKTSYLKTKYQSTGDLLRISKLWPFYRYQRSITRIFRIDIYRIVGETCSAPNQPRSLLYRLDLIVMFQVAYTLQRHLQNLAAYGGKLLVRCRLFQIRSFSKFGQRLHL